MRLKLDGNLCRHLKPILAGLGHEVLTASDEGLLSRSDMEVAAAAAREDRMLLTLDVEFADLRKHPPGSHPGIIVFHPSSFGPSSENATTQRHLHSCRVRMRWAAKPLSLRGRGKGEGQARPPPNRRTLSRPPPARRGEGLGVAPVCAPVELPRPTPFSSPAGGPTAHERRLLTRNRT